MLQSEKTQIFKENKWIFSKIAHFSKKKKKYITSNYKTDQGSGDAISFISS